MIDIKSIYESLICEGGASGHMSHIFEDPDLKFNDLKNIFTKLFKGQLSIEEKCLSPDSVVQLEKHGKMTIKDVVDNKIVDNILTYDFNNDCVCYESIEDWVKNSDSDEWLRITLDDGTNIMCTPNHRIYNDTLGTDVKAEKLNVGDTLIVQ